ncbi:MAG: glycosyltransferase [Culicoidibacterales bacterium]
MKILHVITSLSIGGAETLVADMAIEMNKQHEVTILALGAPDSFLTERVKAANVKVVKLTTNIKSVKNVWWLLKNLNKYDVVHSHLSWAQYFVFIAKILTFNRNTKCFTTEHNTTNRRQENKLFQLFEKQLYSQFSAIICINQAVYEAMKQWQPSLKERFVIIQNGINVTKFNKAQPIAKTHKIRIVMTAAFRHQKDQDTLVKAMVLLPNDYELLLVGNGERKEILEQLVAELQLQEKISFLGIRSDVEQVIKSADVFVLSSHWEGLPLSVIEAMAAGIPIVASEVPGLKETVQGVGLLFEHENPQQLAEIIQTLTADEKLYRKCVEQGKAMSSQYDFKTKVSEHLALYQINKKIGSIK